ncbi:MAG: DNA gyrase/topoisomerase IV subunit A [Chitinophagales bacterium]
MSEEEHEENQNLPEETNDNITSIKVDGMYENWFLEYASYVILERAVPYLIDGMKPVQRRILHSMKEMDDGRYHKVANIIGQTMQYHPHGDMSIGAALVNIGQKELLIDMQGNWGDFRTGDSAAAPRYIEARLSKFALEVLFNKQTTEWQLSYDGRKQEPVALPVKFPMLLAQGAEGIAVGLSTKIMPHNFIELIKGSIKILQGGTTKLIPDFPTGGYLDASDYNRGKRGGRIKVRAKIDIIDKKTLHITEIPFGTNTTSLIDSILKANEKGKIKIKKIVDNTAKNIELAIDLPSGVSPDVTIDALYAFTNCEVSISPLCCVIYEDKPQFLTVDDILEISTLNTKDLLRQELEIKKGELEEKWHMASLEKIFIENRVYRDIEECETFEAVIEAIDLGMHKFIATPLKPNKGAVELVRELTEDDILRLTEIKIKRISKFDSFKADEIIKGLVDSLEEVKHHLANLTQYAIDYFQHLLDKYGKGKERKTIIKNFQAIEVSAVVANNAKLYANLKEGFVGMGLKKEEFITECSDIDDIITFRKNGTMMVSRIDDKKFVGKDIIHIDVWKKGDERTIYHLIYADVKSGKNYVKRFAVKSITREKEYVLTKNEGAKVLYFAAHPNSESEIVSIQLSQNSKARQKQFLYDFADLAIKGRNSAGNVISKYTIRKVEQKEVGASTLGGVNIWIDEVNGRLNKDERGKHLGEFDTGDQILVIYNNGEYEQTNFDLSNHFDMKAIAEICKLAEKTVVSAIYYDGDSKEHYVKRFNIDTKTERQKYAFISEHRSSKLNFVSVSPAAQVQFTIVKGKAKEKVQEEIVLSEFIDVKNRTAKGNRLSQYDVFGKIKNTTPEIEEAEVIEEKKEEFKPIPKAAPIQRKPDPKAAPQKTELPDADKINKKADPKDKGYKPGDTLEFDF